MTYYAARLVPLVIFTGIALFLWQSLTLKPQELPSAKLGQPLPVFTIPALNPADKPFNSIDLKGQVCLINVWASWCSACAYEQFFLMQLKNLHKLPIYGLNYKDDPDRAQAWLETWGNPYEAIGVDSDGKIGIDLGVYGNPETFLIDKQGIIRYRHAGIMDEAVWQKNFLPMVIKLQG